MGLQHARLASWKVHILFLESSKSTANCDAIRSDIDQCEKNRKCLFFLMDEVEIYPKHKETFAVV